MSLFNDLQNGNRPQNGNMQEALNQLRSNPAQMLKQAGFNVPANLNNPQAIVNHLMQSGQINNQKLQQLQRMAQMMGRR